MFSCESKWQGKDSLETEELADEVRGKEGKELRWKRMAHNCREMKRTGMENLRNGKARMCFAMKRRRVARKGKSNRR